MWELRRWLAEREEIFIITFSFSELDWVEMRRTGGQEGTGRGRAGVTASYKLDIGKLIVLPIDYIKATPPSAVSQLVLVQDILLWYSDIHTGRDGRHSPPTAWYPIFTVRGRALIIISLIRSAQLSSVRHHWKSNIINSPGPQMLIMFIIISYFIIAIVSPP